MNLSRGLILLSTLCAALFAQCSDAAPEPWTIASLRLSQDEPQPGLREFAFSEEALRVELERALASVPRFRFDVAASRARARRTAAAEHFHCRLEIALARESASQIVSGALDAEVGLIVELWRAEGLPRLMAEGVGRAPFFAEAGADADAADAGAGEASARAEQARAAAYHRALGQALRQALDAQKLQLEAIEKPTPALIADLGADDVRRRDYAIRALGERRAAEALHPLIARLSEGEEPALVLRAAAALGSLGDERAIPALIEAAERESLPARAALLAIIALIGGPMAEGYLFTLSTGHPSDEVRRLAQLQLDALEMRGAPPPERAERAAQDASGEERHP